MEKELKRFFIKVFFLFLTVCFVSQLLFLTVFETYNFPGRIISVVFVWIVTCAFHYWLMTTVNNRPKAFNRVFMMQTTLKLLLYMACIVVYLVLYRQYAIPFTVHFLVLYLIFAVFEVVSILKFVKKEAGVAAGKTNFRDASENIH